MQRVSLVTSWRRTTIALCSMAFLVCASASVAFADADVTMTEGSPTDINTWTFAPGSVTVNVGQAVTWTNKGAQGHSATADTGNAFDTGIVAAGNSTLVVRDPLISPTYIRQMDAATVTTQPALPVEKSGKER